MRMINCQRCGKEIEQRGNRKYCTQCRKIADDERYLSHRKESKDEKIKRLEEENEKLRGNIERMKIDTSYDMKDINSLYEENKKLKELQICGKTVAERIEDDKRVVRE